jgi:ABC-type multidrug transport system fused ATPase/permease subunit
MAEGQVRCAGTPTFLKRRFGVGYELVVVRRARAGEAAGAAAAAGIVALVLRHVPEAVVAGNVGAELTVRMPFSASPAFPALMSELDARSDALGVKHFGVSVSNLQDIFMRVAAGDGGTGEDEDTGAGAAVESEGKGAGAAAAADVSTLPKPLRRARTTAEIAVDMGAVAAASAGGHVDSGAAASAPHSLMADDSSGGGGGGVGGGGGPAALLARTPSGKPALADVRASARRVQTGCGVFARHFGALFLKRAQSSRRDYKALLYTLGIPIVMTLGGLLLLKANPYLDSPDVQLSTAVLNTARNRASPLHPNLVPITTFKSGDERVDSEAASRLARAIPPENATFQPRLTFSAASLAAIDAADSFGFVTAQSAPDRDLQRLSSFLLADRSHDAGAKYLAYALLGAAAANTSGGSGGVSQLLANPNVPTLISQQAAGVTLPESATLTYAAFHNTSWAHSGPAAANLMNSAAYRATAPGGAAAASITARTHPLPFTLRQNNLISAFFTFSSAIILVMAFAFFPASVAIFVTKEREVSAKHQQLISGVSVQAYWLSNYAFDMLSFVVPAAGSILLTRAFGITQFTSTDASRLSAFITVFALYGASVTPFTYIMTYFFKDHSTAQNVSLIVGIVALVLMIAALIMSQVASSCRADQVLRFVWRLLPAFCLGNSLVSLSFLDQLPLIDATCDAFQGIFKPVSSYQPYDAFDLRATGYNIAFMAVQAPLYLALAILIDVALANPHVRLVLAGGGPGGAHRALALLRAFFTPASAAADAAAAPAAEGATAAQPFEEDADVEAERARVAASALLPARSSADVVQLQSLRKVYSSSGKVAVRSLSFGLEVGDVFGFLGINGAGKTTTLQMLSGDVLPSAGTALICGFDILREQEEVRRCLGYCPQWDALLENNTVREQ